MKMLSLQTIEESKKNFTSLVKKTPLEFSRRLSSQYSCSLYLKREDLQRIRSYKIRGAYTKISSLNKHQQQNGVVCASAGNHAQGVALTSANLGIKCSIFMPKTTPGQKINKTKKFGRQYCSVELVGDTFDEAYSAAMEYCENNNAVFVHPFNDYQTIAGQGTAGLEVCEKLQNIDYVIVPVGGGGLLAGVGSVIKQLSPQTTIIGVEPKGASSLTHCLYKDTVEKIEGIETFVDGASVSLIGDKSFEIIREVVDEVITVPENRLCSTLLEVLQEDGLVLEPAGALALDALKDLSEKIVGKNVVCFTSGGNFDFERLPEVKERSLKYEGLKKYYVLHFPQRAGALKEFLEFLGPEDDIVRFEYLKKTNKEKGAALIGIESLNSGNFETIEKNLNDNKFNFEDITNNELYYDLLI